MSDAARIAVMLLLCDYVASTYLFVLAVREYPVTGSLLPWLAMYFFTVIQPLYVAMLHYRWLIKGGHQWTRMTAPATAVLYPYLFLSAFIGVYRRLISFSVPPFTQASF